MSAVLDLLSPALTGYMTTDPGMVRRTTAVSPMQFRPSWRSGVNAAERVALQ